MDIVVQEGEQKGLFLNIAKSYTMVFSKSSYATSIKYTITCVQSSQYRYPALFGSLAYTNVLL